MKIINMKHTVADIKLKSISSYFGCTCPDKGYPYPVLCRLAVHSAMDHLIWTLRAFACIIIGHCPSIAPNTKPNLRQL